MKEEEKHIHTINREFGTSFLLSTLALCRRCIINFVNIVFMVFNFTIIELDFYSQSPTRERTKDGKRELEMLNNGARTQTNYHWLCFVSKYSHSLHWNGHNWVQFMDFIKYLFFWIFSSANKFFFFSFSLLLL